MAIDSVNIFELASKRLQWISDRQKAISENIANADVAGYRAKEVQSFESYLEEARGASAPPEAEVVETEVSWGKELSGNNVVLEEQLLDANSAAGQYRMATNLYRKAHEMLLTVVSTR